MGLEFLEALAEAKAVGEAKVGGTVHSSKRLPEKTPKKPTFKAKEEVSSPIVQKFIDDEVEKRLKIAIPQREALATRLFQEGDEDDAQGQLEESLQMMKKADERVKKI